MKDFLKSWGWLLTIVSVPVILMLAAERKFATRAEFTPVKERIATVYQAFEYHASDGSDLHYSYETASEKFVPRLELSPILGEIKQDQKETNLKLDRVLQELLKP